MLVVGDLHFDEPARYSTGEGNLYLKAVTKALDYVLQSIAKEKEDVVFLGDVFEKKDKIQNRVKNALVKVLGKGLKKGLNYWFIVGNHDRTEDGVVSIEFLKGFGSVVKKSVVKEIEGFRVLFLPWSEKKQKLDLGGVDFVMGHFRVEGCEMGGITDEGDECYVLDDFADAIVVDGHYHKMQKLGDKFCAIGSLVQTDFGDIGQKYVLRIDEWEGINLYEIPLFIDRQIVHVRSVNDVNSIGDLSGKWVKFVVDVEGDVNEVINRLRQLEVFWYEVELVRKREQQRFISRDEVIGGLEEYIQKCLEQVDEEKRELYRDIIAEVLRVANI